MVEGRADPSGAAHSGARGPDDSTLVGRSMDGDHDAYRQLFQRHAGAVHAFAQRRTRSADIADDVTAVAFEKAWDSLNSLGRRHGDRFRPWIFRIAANEMASLMRSQSRRRTREHLAASRGQVPGVGRDGNDRFTAGDTVESVIGGVDGSDTVLEALSTLSPRHQEVISLRYLADMSPAETATALGVSRGSAGVLLHRALAALRKNLEVIT